MVETFFKDNQKLERKYPEDELEYQNKIKRKIQSSSRGFNDAYDGQTFGFKVNR